MVCKICGKEFEPPKKRGVKPSVCSNECFIKHKKQLDAAGRERARLRKNKNIIGSECICPVCGKSFIKTTSTQKYCSKECRRKHDHEANKAYRKKYRERHANAPRSHDKIDNGITPFKDIIAQCKATGLSYGEYVQQHNL